MCVGGCCDRSGNKADKFILRNCLSNSDFQECLAYLKLPSSLTWSCQWTDGHGGLRDPRSSPLPHCRWEEVRRKEARWRRCFGFREGSGHLSASLGSWQAPCLTRSHFNFLFLAMQASPVPGGRCNGRNNRGGFQFLLCSQLVV